MELIEVIESGFITDENKMKKIMEIENAIEKFHADVETADVRHQLIVDGGAITIETTYEDVLKYTDIDFKNGNFVVNDEEAHESITAQIILNNIELELFEVY
ncbi:hypothetical protein, partial [Streptomyces atratus]|uniref:hypothetical protein n=1 Tax=Streptomyces atratus TaxID=1893 RepID=UPI00366865DA